MGRRSAASKAAFREAQSVLLFLFLLPVMAWLARGYESVDVMFDDLGRRKIAFTLMRCLGYIRVTG